ncbi:kinesin motor domain containing protein [Microsporum canis CBS 113480]|uniref:Kinesin motor domain containing protein n=1 Tax=Arthroderma otae (strain ATCC MYA-4605 / CBS 113480) TaxID=554155 RepID=C5FQ91_ARTOC|nr:kinesin motor domain containing protein [Microsporum canis CBS 113480]EEQ32044.1 kinesin motor domain containing protein [Microsporum canis CBS 113480]
MSLPNPLVEHKAFFVEKVGEFKPAEGKKNGNESEASSDTTISARIRPILHHEWEAGHVPGLFTRGDGGGNVDVHELRLKVNGQPALNSSSFLVDRAYGPECTTKSMYDDFVAPLVPWAWGGGIGTFFAYGQTGSGKTYTVNEMETFIASDLLGGNIPGRRSIHMSVFELAGKAAFASDQRHGRFIWRNPIGGYSRTLPSTIEDFLDLIKTSMSFRLSAPTLKNDASSRSHAICRIRIENKDDLDCPDGLLFLIDLAGSETAADSRDHTPERMKETRDINSSLSMLKDCIRGRATWNIQENTASSTSSKHVHIPFRNTTLTKVLKHVFDVNSHRSCKTAVVACVSPSAIDASQGKSSLRYAEMLRVQSGSPAVDPSHVAPTESGVQICKLPKSEFVSRCLKTAGVRPEQARAFFDKIWQLHVDSRSSNTKNATTNETKKPSIPFKERLKPGMFVRVTPQSPNDPIQFLMLLAPEGAFDPTTTIAKHNGDGCSSKYICAAVAPSIMIDAYELYVAQQRIVKIEDMEAEVLMEYDSAMRYYFITV